jgi:serine/threonine protein kinase
LLFWEFPAHIQELLVSTHLSKWGTVSGRLETPESFVFTLGNGRNTVVAKAPKVDADMPSEKIRERLTVFLHEANHIYRVCHLSLVQRFSYVEVVHGLPFLISAKRHMTLRDAMEEGPLGETETLAVGVQIAHALAYLRTRGVVTHQDLKPENVFLDEIRKKFVDAEQHPLMYQCYLADFDLANAAVLYNQKWPRLSEQLSPILKWIPCGLPTVQSCPRRRASLATNARRGGQLGAHQRSSSYAAIFSCGKPAKYASSGVARPRLEWPRCALYQARYSAMSARAALTLS